MEERKRLKPIKSRREYLIRVYRCPYCKQEFATQNDAEACRKECSKNLWKRKPKEDTDAITNSDSMG